MIIQRLFSSKAQKARRRKYDLEQGASSRYSNDISSIGDRGLKDAQSQDKMLGRKKTEDLIKKGEDHIKGSSVLKNKKEMEEVGRARNLLKAGRERNQDRKFKSLYDGKRKEDLNSTINKKGTIVNPSKWERQEAVKRAQLTNPNKVKKSIAEHEKKAAELKAKKLAGEKLKKNLKTGGKVAGGAALLAGAAIGAKKLADKKKAKKEEKK